MTPRRLHDDLETVTDAALLHEAAHKSFSSPICDQCALANGAIEPTREIIGLSMKACCICGNDRMCSSLRDWRWSRDAWATMSRPWLVLETK
jgi:hypothetical protein